MLGRNSKDKGLDRYYSDAQDWDFDRAREAHRQKRLAFFTALAGLLFGLLMLVWHIAFPLRSVEPYVIRVDRTTGATDVMTRLTNNRDITVDEAVNKYFLGDYVRLRESWIAAASRDYLRKALALSDPAEDAKLTQINNTQSPSNPNIIYGSDKAVSVAINQISFINARVAQVRFTRTIAVAASNIVETSNWVATIDFKYLDKPVTEAGRLDNPLGFQVVSYRADPEIAR